MPLINLSLKHGRTLDEARAQMEKVVAFRRTILSGIAVQVPEGASSAEKNMHFDTGNAPD